MILEAAFIVALSTAAFIGKTFTNRYALRSLHKTNKCVACNSFAMHGLSTCQVHSAQVSVVGRK
jgi:hypothetical protein